MRPRIELPAVVLLILMALTACVGVSKKELQLLGSSVTPANVDFVDLQAYAVRAKTAYAPEAAIRSAFPATVRVGTPGKTDTQYFVERDDKAKAQYISIRGTANRENILEDIEVKIRSDLRLDIPVHAGFDRTTRIVYDDMKPFLRKNYKTYIAGHSLGGAIAALLAIYLVEDGYDVERIVTFGQPKFTTTEGVKRVDFLKLTRVVDRNDIVPMLPPAGILNRTHGSYQHAGPEIILLDGARFVYLPTHDADRISLGELGRSLNIASLSDHHMDHYLARIGSKTAQAVQVPYDQREKYVAPGKVAAAP